MVRISIDAALLLLLLTVTTLGQPASQSVSFTALIQRLLPMTDCTYSSMRSPVTRGAK